VLKNSTSTPMVQNVPAHGAETQPTQSNQTLLFLFFFRAIKGDAYPYRLSVNVTESIQHLIKNGKIRLPTSYVSFASTTFLFPGRRESEEFLYVLQLPGPLCENMRM